MKEQNEEKTIGRRKQPAKYRRQKRQKVERTKGRKDKWQK